MHRRIFDEFDRICRERRAAGGVLEIGAVDAPDTLLALPALAGARSRIGVNLDVPSHAHGFDIRCANANSLTLFADASFDVVLSNAVHEHDPRFWRSVAEIHRVTRAGGLIVIGVPGFAKLPIERTLRRLARLPLIGSAFGAPASTLATSTLCLQVHRFPEDYYRFSPQAMREVFLEGLRDVDIRIVMTPPRIIGAGIKP